ncbi:DsrE/DsrF/TusD sulfur relay family protein [Shewanella psychrotolerans]|uniref:DsrE/DsrF/TusD sulfur relay family protein n=1 Tax=Shewanella psychrotolerans TaxID=2864206 RepID=UPI001C659B22|nr:DsrE family protein [Shewanella psychrotolerans]QYK01404.1 DsrE family protein [Shewanella psychrotolerans]
MQHLLIIVNDAPYGSERLFNALRLAIQLNEQERPPAKVKLFLLSDAITAVLPKQNPSEGYNIQQMLEIVIAQGSTVKFCGSCMHARGLADLAVIEGCQVATMDDLAQWVLDSDKTITF